MDLQLQGKRALVTGSSSGIGAATARVLAAEGAVVAVHGRDRERAGQVAQAITEAGGRAVVVLGDLSSDDEAERVGEEAVKLLGGVDILINNAGGSGKKTPWDEADSGEWADQYNRNVLSIVRLVRRLVPPMQGAGWGRVVNISSGAGMLPAAAGAEYSASKAAVNNLTLSLSKEVGKDGVTVNAVSPGPIFTPKLETAFRGIAQSHGWADAGRGPWTEVEEAVVKNVFTMSIPHVGSAEDVAYAVVFLCSPLAGFITGANLRVDGGTVPTL